MCAWRERAMFAPGKFLSYPMRSSGHPYSHPDKMGWLQCILWVVGCAALFYCILVWAEAAITQARLAQMLARTRADKDQTQPAALTTTPAASKPASLSLASAGIPLLVRLEIPRIGVSAMVLEGAGSRTLRVGLGHVPGTLGPRCAVQDNCKLWLRRSQQSLFSNPPMGTWKPFGQELFFQRRRNDEATVFSRLVSDPGSTASVAHVRGDSLCPLADPLGLLLRH